jgi:aminoglycoside phosphotransferase (APT) family kinase protein
MLSRREVVDYYAERTGRSTGHWAFYEVYGRFRLAVIAQQIYYRYQQGQTRNPAFRNFWMFVTYLGWRCERIIRRSGLE